MASPAPAVREHRRSRVCDPPIVEKPRPRERLDRVAALRVAHAPLREPRVELGHRAVAGAQRAAPRSRRRPGLAIARPCAAVGSGRRDGFLLERRRASSRSAAPAPRSRPPPPPPPTAATAPRRSATRARLPGSRRGSAATTSGCSLQEGGRVLAPLAEPLVAEAEVRARLLHDLPLDARRRARCPPTRSRSRR